MFNKNLLETMSDEDIEQLVSDHMGWAIEELGNSPLQDYIQFFIDISYEAFVSLDKQEKSKLKDVVTRAYNANIVDEIIDSKIILTDELKHFIENNAYLIDTNLELLLDKASKNIKDELILILKQSGIEVN